jgi:hypothetical protein
MTETIPAASRRLLAGRPELLFRVHAVRLADSDAYNSQLAAAFDRLEGDPSTRRSHFLHGRYENLYPARERLPEIEPLLATLETVARQILQTPAPLRTGFWFNRMAPGDVTTLHSHEENDELLSAVYYVSAPRNCGRLRFRDDSAVLSVEPEPGLMLLFPPGIPHEVERHRGNGVRLSVAFNVGPGIEGQGPVALT